MLLDPNKPQSDEMNFNEILASFTNGLLDRIWMCGLEPETVQVVVKGYRGSPKDNTSEREREVYSEKAFELSERSLRGYKLERHRFVIINLPPLLSRSSSPHPHEKIADGLDDFLTRQMQWEMTSEEKERLDDTLNFRW